MDVHAIRLLNLETLILKYGSAAKIAEKIDSAPSVFSVMRNPKYPDKNMGGGMARRIEEAFGLGEGWMDKVHPENIAEQQIKSAGFMVAHTPSDTASINWKRWSRPDFIVSRKGIDLSVYVEIHPKTRLGLPMTPENTKSFVYIREDQVEQAGEILTHHFEKYAQGQLPEDTDAEPMGDSIEYRIPVLDYIQAGAFTEIGYQGEPLGYDLVTPELKDCFALKVRNDSMLPTLSEGMLVYVRPQHDANSGDLVIAQVNGDTEATIKRLRRDGGQTYLVPDNDKYDPIKVTESLQCKIIGIVVSARINFK